jgi:hypothetical protein
VTYLKRLTIVALLALAGAGAVQADQPVAPRAADQAARAASEAVRDAEPAVATPPPKAPERSARTAPAAAKPKAVDRLELDTTQITGNRELPKVMVIVPWKRAEIGDLVGRPVNSLVDEALQPVDRAEFRREIDYYGALTPDRPRDETHVTGGAPKERPEK